MAKAALHQSGFIYEVTVTLPIGELDRMADYMRARHIAEVLEHDAFSGAALFLECVNELADPAPSTRSFTTHYYISSMEQFETYRFGYGLSMREDFSRELGNVHATVTRRLLSSPEVFAGN